MIEKMKCVKCGFITADLIAYCPFDGTILNTAPTPQSLGIGKCEHLTFTAHVDVNRLMDEKDENLVRAFVADIRVKCADCGLPFEWVGFSAGYRGDEARVDTSAQELRAPLKPKGCLAMPGIPGFNIKLH